MINIFYSITIFTIYSPFRPNSRTFPFTPSTISL
nr:MAG TPA: hypothetical protein [Caudoviricetes sp.]